MQNNCAIGVYVSNSNSIQLLIRRVTNVVQAGGITAIVLEKTFLGLQQLVYFVLFHLYVLFWLNGRRHAVSDI